MPQSFTTLKSLFDLSGRTAVLTGGSGWLGRVLCEALAEMGADVCLASRNEAEQIRTIDEIKSLMPDSKVSSFLLDITDRKSVEACFGCIMRERENVDILINNAYSGISQSLEDATDSGWHETIDTGLTGYMRCTQAALSYMRNAQRGVIVNISSMYGLVAPYPEVYAGNAFLNPPVYGAVKAAILQLTRYTAVHTAAYGIRANSISPGPFPSEIVQQDQTFITRLSSKTPLNRIGRPFELKGAVAFLASDASSYVTGQNIIVDGGWTAW